MSSVTIKTVTQRVQQPWTSGARPSKNHTARGGVDVLCCVMVVLALSAALAFATYARQYQYYLAVERFDHAYVNVSNLASLISFFGTIIAGLWTSGLTVVGARWLLRQLNDNPSKLKIGHWSAMASHGSLKHLRYWIVVPRFLIAILTSWAIPSMLSGALVPTITTVVGDAEAFYFRISGAPADPTGGMMTSCYDTSQVPFPLCPGGSSDQDLLSAMRNALLGTYPYTVGGLQQANGTGIAGQYSLGHTSHKLFGRGLRSSANAISTTACVPTVIPSSRCTIIRDPANISQAGTVVSYSDDCSTNTIRIQIDGLGVLPRGCFAAEDTYRLYYNLFGVLANVTGSYVVTQLQCDLSAIEMDHKMVYDQAKNQMALTGRCGENNPLTSEDLVPLTTSVQYILQSSPYSNGVSALTAPIATAIQANSMALVNDMLVAGMTAAAQSIYLAALPQSEGGGNPNASTTADDTPGLSQTTATVTYRAYGWGFGTKGLGYVIGLGVCTLISLIVSGIGVVGKRLRYDPSDFRQTLVIALESGWSGLRAPVNTSHGDLPDEFDEEELSYENGHFARPIPIQAATAPLLTRT